MRLLVPLHGNDLSHAVLTAIADRPEFGPDTEFHLLMIIDPSRVHGRPDHPVSEPITQDSGLPGAPEFMTHHAAPKAAETRGDALVRARVVATEEMERLAHEILPGADVHCHVEWSKHPAATILSEAEALNIDEIAMASHGHSRLAHLLHGSVTESVIRKSTRPVLVLGPAAGLAPPVVAAPTRR